MNKPKIRVKGFEGEWRKTKLNECLKLRRGLTYHPSDIDNGGIRVLRSSNIQDDLFILNDDDVRVKTNAVNIKPARTGDILITAANGSKNLVGKHCIVFDSKDSPMVHGGFMLLGETSIPEFINASMSAIWFREEVRIHSAGGNGSISNLNKKDMDDFSVSLPTDDRETHYVGSFFKNFDGLIGKSQDRITSLKSLKTCYLNRLFPIGGGTSRLSA